jgi:hypothetical protein
MPFAMGVPGFGWKAATMDATSILSKGLMPFAPVGALLCRIPWVYRHLWPLAQRVLKIDEKVLPVKMDEWHEYSLEWERDRVRFVVDGQEALTTRFAPRGALGFVAWMDNQSMVATPQAHFRHGALGVGKQWMEIAALEVKSG